jgi:hypothetical protein
VRFNTTEDEKAEVSVFNIMGMKVATLFNEKAKALELHEVKFNAENLPTGVYFIKLITGKGETKVERVIFTGK